MAHHCTVRCLIYIHAGLKIECPSECVESIESRTPKIFSHVGSILRSNSPIELSNYCQRNVVCVSDRR